MPTHNTKTAPALRKVEIRNYRCIAESDVDLQRLNFLVGPNGSGKSSFLDAIKFIAEALALGPEAAVRKRGGIWDLQRRDAPPGDGLSILLHGTVNSGEPLRYRVRLTTSPDYDTLVIAEEECSIGDDPARSFRRGTGSSIFPSDYPFEPLGDRLALTTLSGTQGFRPAYDLLAWMEVYDLSPATMALPQRGPVDDALGRAGENAALVWFGLPEATRTRIQDFMRDIVPGLVEIEKYNVGGYETIGFRFDKLPGGALPLRASMASDGTLRALGILLALFQSSERAPLVVGLEEPENAIHPAAERVLLRAMREAAECRQLLISSHNPDLLDDPDIEERSVIAVGRVGGATRIGPIDKPGREALKKRMFTVGELLRMEQLRVEGARRSSK